MDAVIKVYWDVNPFDIDVQIPEQTDNVFIIPLGALITNPSATGGGIQSVNGKTGANITLNADEVGAEPVGSVNALRIEVNNSLDLKANLSYVDQNDSSLQDQLNTKASSLEVAQSLANKADLINGVIPENQLPSFVDDVLEYPNQASFPAIGESGKIYIAVDVNKTFRWSGTIYAEIGSGGVALGETSSTAYRGDRGKIAYDHSQTQGNPHNTTTTDIVEGTKQFFTEQRVRQTPLTGLNVASAPSNPINDVDTLLFALAKLQAQLNLVSAPVWVSATTIGDVDSTYVVPQFTQLEFARVNGMLMVRGWMQIRNLNSSAIIALEITNPKYKIINPYNSNTATAYVETLYAGNATTAQTRQFEVFSNGVLNNATQASTVRQYWRNLVVVTAATVVFIRPQYLGILADPT